MTKRIFLMCLLVIAYAVRLTAQQDPQFSQYMFNTIYYNPAYAGVEGISKFSALHRSQWLGYSPTSGGGGAPTTQLLTFSTPIFKLNSGFGAYITHDNLGPFNNMEAQASYAYHIGIKNGKLSLGMRAGIYSQTINFDLYQMVDNPDPRLLDKTGSITQVRPDLAVGAFFKKEKFFVGASFDHLTHASFDFGSGPINTLKTHAYVTAGYIKQVNFDLKFQFSTLIQTDMTTTTVNLSALAYLKDTMWGGLSFRQGESATLMLGYAFLKDKSMKLGYALDYIVKDQAAKQATSHEFMLMYDLPVNVSGGKKIVRTPRYRKS